MGAEANSVHVAQSVCITFLIANCYLNVSMEWYKLGCTTTQGRGARTQGKEAAAWREATTVE